MSSAPSSSSILVKPTDFESTVVVCLANDQVRYCSLVQPSLSFDLLNPNFEKLKLVGTIVVLFVVFIVTKPYVANKKLKSQWLDYKNEEHRKDVIFRMLLERKRLIVWFVH